jgi:Tannase and feruloyl esterase
MPNVAVWLAAIASVTVAAFASPARGAVGAPKPVDPTAKCNALQREDFSAVPEAPTEVTASHLVDATGDLPAYCQVLGYVHPNVGIEIRLPSSDWNGKFFYAGCSAACGSIGPSWTRECDYPLIRGYACILSDMGHQSSQGDGLWAYHNLQAKVDFGFRATHVTAVAGKAITEVFYSRAPSHSYYMGCSTGGRQGMVEAQRFPWDFDGIISGAPVISESGTAMDFIWNLEQSADKNGQPMFSIADLKLIHQAVLAKSDMDDGLKDGIIGDPRTSKFDPSELVCRERQKSGCLTAVQAQAVKKIYAGPMNSKGEKLYHGGGIQPGSELNWGNYLVQGSLPAPFEKTASDTTRYMLSDLGPTWKFTQFDFDRDSKRLGIMGALYSAENVDLRPFKAAGGKLIVYQGWDDPAVAPLNSVDYYETVEKTMGGRTATQEFFRLYTVPGMNHCFGGVGAYAIDYVTYMEAWVEHGMAPDKLRATHLVDATTVPPFIHVFPATPAAATFSRPVYPYPLQARYKGSGDPNDWASFVPVDFNAREVKREP